MNKDCFINRPIVSLAKRFGRANPELLVSIRYFLRFHRFLNLANPQDLNEKILYLSLKTDTTLWTKLADKFQVREYVKSQGLSNILVKLYAHWQDFNQIDFSKLPESFIIKSVQGSGDVVIVKNKLLMDKSSVLKSVSRGLTETYGELEGGKHYMRIRPSVVVEELLVNSETQKKLSTSLIDYKIWCFNGRAYYILTCHNRDHNGIDMMTYDMMWKSHPEYHRFNGEYRRADILPKPVNFDKMVEYAEILAKPFPVVRVDFYNIDGEIYFGEMTFTSLGGMMNYYTDDYLQLCGKLIHLNTI